MPKVKVIKYVYPENYPHFKLNEIHQDMNLRFAILDRNYQQLNLPAKCRDFLGDFIWSRITGNPVKIYGMQYSFKETPYDIETTRFSLSFPNDVSFINFKENFHIFTEMEREYSIPESKLLTCTVKKMLVIESDKVWQSACWKLSLYTFLLRLLCYKEGEALGSPDYSYNSTLTKSRKHNLMTNIFNEEDDCLPDLHNNHNYTGFISVINGTGPNKVYHLADTPNYGANV